MHRTGLKKTNDDYRRLPLMALDDIRCTPSTLFHLPNWQPTPLPACMGCGAPTGCSDIMRRKGCRDIRAPLRPRVERKKTMAQDLETTSATSSSVHSVEHARMPIRTGRASICTTNTRGFSRRTACPRTMRREGRGDGLPRAYLHPLRQLGRCNLFCSCASRERHRRCGHVRCMGNGYIEFAEAEIENVKQCIPQFSEVMTTLKEEQIAKVLDGTPVSEDVYNSLKTIYLRPDLPKTQTKEPESHDIAEDGHVSPADEAPEHVHDDRVNDAYHHTEGIRDKVLAAREQCRDFDDFKELLAKEEVGVTESKSGELMFYEARRDENGEILPRGRMRKVFWTGRLVLKPSRTSGSVRPPMTGLKKTRLRNRLPPNMIPPARSSHRRRT